MSERSFLYYSLPAEKIAQRPLAAGGAPRSSSKLLHCRRTVGSLEIADRSFWELPALLRPGDLLVLNNTKVLPNRFFASRPGKTEEIEIFLLKQLSAGCSGFPVECWEALARPLRKLGAGDVINLSPSLRAEVLGRSEDQRRLRLKLFPASALAESKLSGSGLAPLIAGEALVPIPPYVRGGRSDDLDREFYQTVYAEEPGSIAAPTAGFHFTDALLEQLSRGGVSHVFITLHVGQASITLIADHDLDDFQMPKESYRIGVDAARLIGESRARSGRIVAVGTTTVRALESWALDRLASSAASAYCETDIFIRPGFDFKIVNAMITNFHQPGSTHLLMVAAFIGESAAASAYQHALCADYRFLSYGDAMLLER